MWLVQILLPKRYPTSHSWLLVLPPVIWQQLTGAKTVGFFMGAYCGLTRYYQWMQVQWEFSHAKQQECVVFNKKDLWCVYTIHIYIYMYVYITIHQNTYIGRRWGNINKFAGVELDCVKFSRHPVDIVVSHVDIGSRYPK